MLPQRSSVRELDADLRVLPEFWPMKKAERRAVDSGKVLRDGAVSLLACRAVGARL